MPSKEKDDAVDTCQLDISNQRPSGHVGSASGEKDDLNNQSNPEEHREAGDDIPWEKRYEKLWVEVEKREVKSTFRNVAGELKEKFGELHKSRCPAEDVTEEQQSTAESTSAEEESSDDEGEVIVRPAARARSRVLLTIPEQRESGLEDSATESLDNSVCEDRMQVIERAASESSLCQEPDLHTDEECRSPSPQVTAQRESSKDHIPRAFTDGHTIPLSKTDTFLKDGAELGPLNKQNQDLIRNDSSAYLAEAEMNHSEEVPEEFIDSRPASLSRRSASVPGVSDEELEEDMERFKLEVGMLKVVFLDLEKEKSQLQKEVEDGCPSHSRLNRLSFSSHHPCTSFHFF